MWDERDRLFPLRLGERLVADLPRAEPRAVPGRTTYLLLDHPDRSADEVTRFLRSLS